MAGQTLTFQHLEKSFGSTPVLRGINLDVRPGEFLTLLGPSGCGKSTLLRLIAGFDGADSGKLLIGDTEVSGLAPKDRDVAMVFQSYALYPHMTVRQNISVPLEMSRLSLAQRQPGTGWLSRKVREARREIAKEVDRVAEQTGLGALLDRKPSQLSGGQRQRVAVARAMVRQPSVFLMDEPLSNLDAKLRIQMREEIADLHRRTGITFIYVTHDQTEAMAMSDRIAVMEGGEVCQCAAPHEIYNRPERLSVARFVGSVAINEIPVELRDGALFAGDTPLGIAAQGAGDGPATLALRPEALRPVSSAQAAMRLPVAQVEFTGSEVMIRCDGRSLGTDWIRVQLRGDEFAALTKGGRVGEVLSLSLQLDRAMLFDGEGQRMACAMTATTAAERRASDDIPA
jgi:multiple sugar transport system ATP-binding protein